MNDYQLIDLDSKNLKTIWEWRNSEHIRLNMMNDRIIEWEEHLAWYDRIQESSKNIYKMFVINESPIGLINFTDIDIENDKCNWGFYLGEEAPKGTGTLMCYLGLNYAFNELHIRKLCAEVLAFNHASLKIHQKLGFHKEGVLERHLLRSDNYIDVILLALFHEHWILRQDDII
jgi:UDP-4-amino-4,6-dideoxy-N-acetyl-beta-L-altrosamine N-acetyltransferase